MPRSPGRSRPNGSRQPRALALPFGCVGALAAFAAFWVGLLLGGLRCAGQALGLCMGVHAGLNLHLFFLARPC